MGVPLVRPIAVTIWKAKRAADCQLEDLMQSGQVGLIDACDSYDAQRRGRRRIKTPFLGWAAMKIRWAILADMGKNSLRADSCEYDSCDGGATRARALFDRCDPEPLPDAVYLVREAIEWLPDPHRTVVLLRLEGLPHHSVGRQMGISTETARQFERQACQALRSRASAVPALRRAA